MSRFVRCSAFRRLAAVMLAVALVALGLTACLPPLPGTPTAITTEPPLFPAFQPDVSDYVIRCGPGYPIAVHVATPDGTTVSVNGESPRSGVFGVWVPVHIGQRFTMVVTTGVTSTYNVRCLPTDFPDWNTTHSGETGAEWYLANPNIAGQSRPVIFDTNGVPMWWGTPSAAFFNDLLPTGNIGSILPSGIEERRLDGSLVRSVQTKSGPADGHDGVLLANGDFAMVTRVTRDHVDLSAVGGPADTSIIDHVIEEIAPDGSLVWSWRTSDHIPVDEMDPQWRTSVVVNASAPYDVYHWNSIEDTGSGVLVSYRYLDAIYDIDRATDAIVWKLGGSTVGGSLTVIDDPVFTGGSHFGGQHDARLLPDGSVTLFDDGSYLGRAPRAVRYQIDAGAHTAKLLESVSDPDIPESFCCGSARRLSEGDWVIGWGGTTIGTESVNGTRHFSITLPGNLYRLIPIAPGRLSVGDLRAAMDAQYSPGGAGIAALEQPPTDTIPYPP